MKAILCSSLLLALLLAGCASPPRAPSSRITPAVFRDEPMASPAAREVGMYALMLLQTGYQFGGKNPSAGLDCSGTDEWIRMDCQVRMRDAMDTEMVLRRCGNATSNHSPQGFLPS